MKFSSFNDRVLREGLGIGLATNEWHADAPFCRKNRLSVGKTAGQILRYVTGSLALPWQAKHDGNATGLIFRSVGLGSSTPDPLVNSIH